MTSPSVYLLNPNVFKILLAKQNSMCTGQMTGPQLELLTAHPQVLPSSNNHGAQVKYLLEEKH